MEGQILTSDVVELLNMLDMCLAVQMKQNKRKDVYDQMQAGEKAI